MILGSPKNDDQGASMPKASREEFAAVETGEAVRFVAMTESELRDYSARRTYRHQEPFFMGMIAGIAQAADSPNLTDGDVRVLMKLLSLLDYENFLNLEIKSVAMDLHRSRESVSRSVKRLVENGIVHKGPRVGRSNTYRLDPSTAWRGKADSRARVEREIAERNWTVHQGGK